MAHKEELEIHILKNGEVRVDIKGGKGQSCENYVRLFEEILGTTRDKQRKPEYYESDSKINIDRKNF